MKCPYCNEVLKEWDRRLYCENMACSVNHEDLPEFVWQDLIDGKKAQDALKVATNYIKWTIDTFEKGLDREADIGGYGEIVLEKINKIITDTKD